MATKTKPAAKPAAKAPAKKKPVEATAPDLADVNDVQIVVGDAHAEVHVNGCFDLDGLIGVVRRVDRARAELS